MYNIIKYNNSSSSSSNNNNNNLRGGRPASTCEGATLQRACHHGQARNTFSSFLCRVLPIPASRPMSSGHFICMAPSPTKKIPDWSLRWSRKHAEVKSGGHCCAMLAAQSVPGWPRSGVLGRPWRPSGQGGGPRGPTESNGDVRQTLRPVWSGGHMSPKA